MAPAGLQFSHVHNKKEWMFSYRNMFMDMRGLLSGSKPIQEYEIRSRYQMTPFSMNMNMSMLMVMGGLSDKLTVMGMFHYSYKQMEMRMSAGSHHQLHASTHNEETEVVKSSGIGDTKLYLMYGLVKTANQQLILGTGINLPSGRINCGSAGSMFSGDRLPYNMQCGSGTWAILPTAGYLRQIKAIDFGVQLSAVLQQGICEYGYRWGNSSRIEPWISWNVEHWFAVTGRLEGNFEQRIWGNDKSLNFYSEPGTNTYNYGGRRIYLFTGVVFKLNKAGNLRTGLEYGFSLYQFANGVQMRTRHTLNVTASCFF